MRAIYNWYMRRALLLPFFAAFLVAQTTALPPSSPQPPAEVDRALRARVKAFYDLLVAHEYRKAEELIAPDSREIYYEREKPRYMKFEITSIQYSEEFTRADVVVEVKLPVTGGLILVPMEMAIPGVWRLLDGAWYWYIPKINVVDMVRSMAGGASPDTQATGVPPALPANPGFPPSLPDTASLPLGLGRPESIPAMGVGEISAPNFTMDRDSVVLKPSTTEKVMIANDSSAPMTLFVLGKLPGIEAAFDHQKIKPGEKAVLSLRAGATAKSGTLLIGVTETKAMTGLLVTVK
jgi:hypothetical protein